MTPSAENSKVRDWPASELAPPVESAKRKVALTGVAPLTTPRVAPFMNAASVPDDFLFTVKAPNSITLTHYYSKQPKRYAEFAGQPNTNFLSVELLEQFLERLSPLGKKLGPIMFQFEYLNKKKMTTKEAFFDRIADFIAAAPKGFEYAIESRNPNYYSPAFFDFLQSHRVGFVYIEGYYMPPIFGIYDEYADQLTENVVIRLHGTDREGMEKRTGKDWSRIIEPRDAELAALADMVQDLRVRRRNIWLLVNNHYEGSAPLTMERIQERVGDSA